MAELQAGCASRDITPDGPVPLAGTFFTRMSDSVHDPLFARALALSDGAITVGIVSLDLINSSRDLSTAVRREVTDAGVHFDEIVFTATHTHTGPELPRYPERDVEYDPDVVDTIEEETVAALIGAHEDLTPASLRVGTAENQGSTINRRSLGGLLGEVDTAGRDVDPHADVDTELSVLVVEPDGGDSTILYNFPCHTTTMTNRRISADWPATAADRVVEEWGEATVSFVNGAAGDIVPRNSYDWHEHYDTKAAFLEAIGNEIGATVINALEDAASGSATEDVTLTARHSDVGPPIKEIDRERLERRHAELTERIEREGLDEDRPLSHPVTREREFIDRDLALDDLDIEELDATIQYVEIGPAALVTLPGEAFIRHGINLSAATQGKTSIIAGYTNDHLGYLPTVEEFEYGGYEVTTCRLSPAGIERLRETAFDLVDR